MTRISVSGVMSGHSGSPHTRPALLCTMSTPPSSASAASNIASSERGSVTSVRTNVAVPPRSCDEPDGLVATGLVDVGDDAPRCPRGRRRAPSPARCRIRPPVTTATLPCSSTRACSHETRTRSSLGRSAGTRSGSEQRRDRAPGRGRGGRPSPGRPRAARPPGPRPRRPRDPARRRHPGAGAQPPVRPTRARSRRPRRAADRPPARAARARRRGRFGRPPSGRAARRAPDVVTGHAEHEIGALDERVGQRSAQVALERRARARAARAPALPVAGPPQARVPAEWTWASTPRAARCARSSASPIGDRQMLPVHTIRTSMHRIVGTPT